jgi:hypothetical protein
LLPFASHLSCTDLPTHSPAHRSMREDVQRLNVILSSCDEGRGVLCRSRLWPRTHVWQSPEQFSLADFTDIQSGQHARALADLKELMAKHLHACQSCAEVRACVCVCVCVCVDCDCDCRNSCNVPSYRSRKWRTAHTRHDGGEEGEDVHTHIEQR